MIRNPLEHRIWNILGYDLWAKGLHTSTGTYPCAWNFAGDYHNQKAGPFVST
jgi:hypothetical protein